MKKKNHKRTKNLVNQNSDKKPFETNQPAEGVTGSLHNQVSKVMSAIVIASLLGMIFSALMSGVNLNNLMKDSILVIILDFILMFYAQINKDKIYFPSYTWWLIGGSYLASILLLCNPYEISLYPFWLIGVVLIAAFINPNFSHVFCYGLIVIAAVTGSFEIDSMVMNLLLGTFMCIMARSLTKFSQLCYALILVCSMNVTLLFAMNNFKVEKVMDHSIGWWILADVSVLSTVYILKKVFKSASYENWYHQLNDHDFLYKQALHIEVKEQELATRYETMEKPENQEQLKEMIVAYEKELHNQALLDATALDAPLLVQMKSESEKLYQHSMLIANLSRRAAISIGADAELAYAGGWYHEIGRLTGKEYVPNGVALIQEHQLPTQIADIIFQHTFKEQLPQSKEAVIVMLSDNIISTAQYVKNRMETQITTEKIIENTFLVRMNKGILNEVNMTIAEFTKLKDFYLSIAEELR